MSSLLKKYRRKLFLSLVLLTLVLVALVFALPILVNTDWVKTKLSNTLSSNLNRKVHFRGDLALKLGLTPEIRINDFEITNPEHFGKSPMLRIAVLTVSAPLIENLRGHFQIATISSEDVKIIVASKKDLGSNWDFKKGQKDPPVQKTTPVSLPMIGKINLKNTSLVLDLPDSTRDFDFKDIVVADFNPTKSTSLKSSLEILKLPVALNLELNSLSSFLSGGNLNFDVKVSQAQEQFSVNGTYRQNAQSTFSINASGKDLSTLSPLFFGKLPGWQDYSLKTKLILPKGENDSFSLSDLSLKIGKNDLAGTIAVKLSPLLVTAKLNSDTFDLGVLSAFLATEEKEVETEAAEEKKEDPANIPYELLNALNANIEINVANLKTPPALDFYHASLMLRLKDGDLEIEKLSAETLGASLDSKFKASPGALEFKLSGTNLDAKAIALAAGGQPTIEGAYNLAFDLKGAGDTWPEIVKTLTGDINLNSQNAKLNSSVLRNTASGLFDILSPVFGKSKRAESECLLLNFRVINGVAKAGRQVFNLKDVFIFGEGQLDFSKDKIKYNFNVRSSNPTLASLIPPFRAFGSIGDPSFVPSVSGAVASVGDTAEMAVSSVFNIASGAFKMLLSKRKEKLSGLDVCSEAYELEQKLLSSWVGKQLDSESSSN
jgi:uncharacterized protein involved in outer membrane biogenesis